MPRRKCNGPTDRELAILRILWDKGPASVRQVNEAMNEDEDTGYTTTLKLMQIMTDKGLLIRDDSQRRHIFRPASSQEKTQGHLVKELLDKAFAGSAEKLVMRVLSAKKVSAEERLRIKEMLDSYKE